MKQGKQEIKRERGIEMRVSQVIACPNPKEQKRRDTGETFGWS